MSDVISGIGGTRYILVVDPNVNERYTMSMLLQRFGYTVASASSVREGIEYLCVAAAVAVFAESATVGDDLTELLQRDLRFREVPLVLVSDGRTPELEERVRKGTLAGLLRAPLNAEEVFKVIQQVIEKGPRRNIRMATALPAKIRDGEGSLEGYVTVLSQYGLFFRSLAPRPAGSRVSVEWSLWDRPVRLEAEVLYVVTFDDGPFSEPGMGMKFLRIDPEYSVLVRAFILDHYCGDLHAPAPDLGFRGGAA